MYKLLTKNTSLNIFGVVLLGIAFFFLQIDLHYEGLGRTVFFVSLYLLGFMWILFMVYKLAGFVNLAPGEDYLPLYVLIFFVHFVPWFCKEMFATVFLVLGLYYLVDLIHSDRRDRDVVGVIAKVSVLFAISVLFVKVYLLLAIFLLIIVLLFYPSFRNVLAIIFSYLFVYYVVYAVEIIFGWNLFSFKDFIEELSQVNFSDRFYLFLAAFEGKFFVKSTDSFSTQLMLLASSWLGVVVLLTVAAISYVLNNFFRLPVRIRRTFVILGIFLLFVGVLNFIYSVNIWFSVLVPLSLFVGYYLTKSNLKLWIKDLSLILVLVLNLLLTFKLF